MCSRPVEALILLSLALLGPGCRKAANPLPALGASGGARNPMVGAGPHEPMGFTPVFDNPMSTPLSTSADQYGFFGYRGQFGNLQLVRDPTAPASPPWVYRHLFPGNQNLGGMSPLRYQAGRKFPSNSGNLYVRMRFRASPNWTHNQNSGTKFFFLGAGGKENGAGRINHFVGFVDPNSPAPRSRLEPFFGTQFKDGPGQNSWYSGYDLGRGVWRDIEWLFQANIPGFDNGKLRIWVDGVLRLSADNVMYFQSGMKPRWGDLWVDPIYGFGLGPTPPFDIWFDVDQWYVSVQ
jgi:hypothetical protein